MLARKYDEILKRNLKNSERMNDSLATISFMRRELDTLEFKIQNTSDDLTDEQLNCMEEAVSVAHNALQNATFLGTCGYTAKDVYTVKWVWTE